MTDQESHNATHPPQRNQPTWVARCIQKIKSNLHERRAKKENESSQDRASRRTANATVAIAVLTAAVVLVGGLQYLIFKAQLKVMADQLVEMKGTGVQTDALIETNKKLASAADTQAQAAKEAAATARESLIIGQRAWIAPTKFSLADVNDARHPLRVIMNYQNVGREPARNVKNFGYYGYIRNPLPPEPSTWGFNPAWKTIAEIQPRAMCANTGADANSVIYPSLGVSFNLEFNGADDSKFTPSDVQALFDEVKGRKSIYYVAGCLSYDTLMERKNSAFCALLLPIAGKDISQWPFGACPVGNEDF